MPADKAKTSVVRITLNLVAASILSGCIVAGAYAYAEPRIVENRKMMNEEAMRRLVPAATEFAPDSAKGRYEARSAKGLEGYILSVEGRGYGGTIKMTAAADTRGRLLGFEILSHNETPGLGDRAAESSFRDQFAGRGAGELEVTKTGEEGKIDAISGATITSKAVASALDKALAALSASISAPAGTAPQEAAAPNASAEAAQDASKGAGE